MSQEAVLLTIKLLFAGASLAIVAIFVVRPVVRMLREKPDIDLLMPDFNQLGEDADELEIPLDPEGRSVDRSEMIQSARDNPQDTALMVQRWLRDRK
jgi:flagellar biosynthesis/type III secretory pathway M-ring protein FliF/YscJ